MKITLAKYSGFCMGVKNAILKIVNEINSTEENIYVYGPLIHNPQTIDVLSKRGLITIDSLDDIDNKQIAVRTHGIPITDNTIIKNRSSRCINLTCPRVARVQAIIKKYSNKKYFTIIVGDKDHAEVIGLKSYAASGIYIISDMADIKKIPKAEKYILVSQTTFDRNLFNNIVDSVIKNYKNIEVIDTICDSTRDRQDEVIKEISNGIDTLVVIGGKNSANTNRLAQIGHENKIKTLHIETEDELADNDFTASKNILVTAGASTPGWIINNVLERLYSIKYKKRNIFINSIKNFLEFIVRTNLLSACAAFFFNVTAQKYIGSAIDYNYGIIAFLYIFSMYSINNYFDRDFLKFSNQYKYKIYSRFGIFLLILSIISMLFSLIISLKYNIVEILILLFSYIFGFLYSTNMIKELINKKSSNFFVRIYNTKIITIFGWLIITVLLPFVYNIDHLIKIIPLAIIFLLLFFLRHMLLDIIAFQGDLILGKETLPVWIGIKNVNKISNILSPIAVIITSYIFYNNNNMIFILFAINILYYVIILNIVNKLNYLISLKYELVVDFNYILFICLFYFI